MVGGPTEGSMSSSPLSVDADGVRPEARKTGYRWLDLSVAFSAILISVVSLFVAVRHGETQEKLVAATSWPLLQFVTTNYADGEQTIVLQVQNNGVGPALVHYVVLRYRGQAIRNRTELLEVCCAPFQMPTTREEGMALDLSSGGSINVIISPEEGVALFRMSENEHNLQLWNSLNAELSNLSAESCYCSVLGDCWLSDFASLHPQEVNQCPAVPPEAYRG